MRTMLRAALLALLFLMGSVAVAVAADICFDTNNGLNTLVGKAFGSLPTPGGCKDFRGFFVSGPANLPLSAHGQACGSSDGSHVSFAVTLRLCSH